MTAQRLSARSSRESGQLEKLRPVTDYVKTVAAIYCGTVCSEAQEAALNNNNGGDIVDTLAQIRALCGEEGACNYLLTLTLTRLADKLLTKLLELRRAFQLDEKILREALEEALRELEEQLRREENYHARFRELAEALRDECTLPLVCLGILLSIDPEKALGDGEAKKRYEELIERIAARVDICASRARRHGGTSPHYPF